MTEKHELKMKFGCLIKESTVLISKVQCKPVNYRVHDINKDLSVLIRRFIGNYYEFTVK